MNFIYQWIDALWLPLGWFLVHKHQRIWVTAFIVSNMIMLRLQSELMGTINYDHGILGFMKASDFTRGQIVYGIITLLYLLLVYFSPRSQNVVVMAASISIFIIASCLSMFVMIL